MSGNKPANSPPPPHPKPRPPPNSAQGVAGLSYLLGLSPVDDTTNIARSPPYLSPVTQCASESGGHPPPPPPHSPPPPNPKSAQLRKGVLIPYAEAPKPGYPPPPPPHSPPPPPPPRSQSDCYTAVAPAFMAPASLLTAFIYGNTCEARIYPMKEVPPGGNTPNPPRPHPDPVSPPPPPPRVDLNKALGMFGGIDILCSKTIKLGADFLSQGGHCGSMVVGRV